MLWPNATRVLKELNLLAPILERSGTNTHFLVQASTGRILMNIALGEFEVPALCIRRSDLLRVLLSAVPADWIHTDCELTGLTQTGSRVRLQFADGRTAEHDAVIGADGLRSHVRASLFGISAPVYRGYMVWRGFARTACQAQPPQANSESWGRGHRFGILHTGRNAWTWYATANRPFIHTETAAARKRILLEIFARWHQPVPELITATADEDMLENGAFDHAPLRHWGQGRVTLLGDAAHPCTPNLGQGGGMAIEDAMVLAGCLSNNRTVESGLRNYELLRRGRTRRIQQRSRLMGRIGQWENQLIVAGRELMTSLLPSTPFEYNLRKVCSWRA